MQCGREVVCYIEKTLHSDIQYIGRVVTITINYVYEETIQNHLCERIPFTLCLAMNYYRIKTLRSVKEKRAIFVIVA